MHQVDYHTEIDTFFLFLKFKLTQINIGCTNNNDIYLCHGRRKFLMLHFKCTQFTIKLNPFTKLVINFRTLTLNNLSSKYVH